MFEPDPDVWVSGVQGTAAALRDSKGTPVLTVDKKGNVGIGGTLFYQKPDSAALNQSWLCEVLEDTRAPAAKTP
jgi:hypothetical protein